MTRILQGFTFLCKLGLLSFLNLTGATKFTYEKKNEKNSGRSYKMTPSCKRTFGTKNRKALECMILTILLFCFNNGDAGVLRCLARFSLVGFFSLFISIDYSRYVQRCVIQFKLTELMNQFGTGSVTFSSCERLFRPILSKRSLWFVYRFSPVSSYFNDGRSKYFVVVVLFFYFL